MTSQPGRQTFAIHILLSQKVKPNRQWKILT